LWLPDIKDDIKEPHLDFWEGTQQPFTRLCIMLYASLCNEAVQLVLSDGALLFIRLY